VILAHFYVVDEVQEIADYVGDSFFLSKVAASTSADSIIFCGVSFMGESAKILNPGKRVFLPDAAADCFMAHMADPADVAKVRKAYDDLAVVCYINSTAALKACSDVCVTSSNAIKIVKALPNKNIYFIPDGNLGHYVKEQVPDKNIILHPGFCPVHQSIAKEDVLQAKKEHPKAEFLAHPECTAEVLNEADYIGSTAGIIKYAEHSAGKEFIIGTELGVLHNLRYSCPDKKFYAVRGPQICVNMKKVTLQKVYDVLKNETNEVFVDDDLRKAALKPLDKMLELANG
jgi:quinolinate synthase